MSRPTPLESLPRLGHQLGIDLRVKRDDLFPTVGGGNKARKIVPVLNEASKAESNALVTTGGMQSNHARVVALEAARRGWRCVLVLHGDSRALEAPTGNLLLMQLLGAEIESASPDQISASLGAAVGRLETSGFRPYLIPGGGHGLAGALAFVDAAIELHDQCKSDGWMPDWLFLASGTGTTHAGLAAGISRLGWSTRVAGISVARTNPRNKRIVDQAYREVAEHIGVPIIAGGLDCRDDWVGGGYERATPSTWAAIRFAAESEGLILDPTYTGKAFDALTVFVRKGEIAPGSRVLFWHTGGLLNLCAAEGRGWYRPTRVVE